MSVPKQTSYEEADSTILVESGREYQAHTAGVADSEDDPLKAILISTGIDEKGAAVSVYVTLTPQTILTLTQELHQVLRAQRSALGFNPDAAEGVMATEQADDDNLADDEEEDEPQDRWIQRAGDPVGLRHLRARAERNPTINLYIASAVIALLALFLILKLFGR